MLLTGWENIKLTGLPSGCDDAGCHDSLGWGEGGEGRVPMPEFGGDFAAENNISFRYWCFVVVSEL